MSYFGIDYDFENMIANFRMTRKVKREICIKNGVKHNIISEDLSKFYLYTPSGDKIGSFIDEEASILNTYTIQILDYWSKDILMEYKVTYSMSKGEIKNYTLSNGKYIDNKHDIKSLNMELLKRCPKEFSDDRCIIKIYAKRHKLGNKHKLLATFNNVVAMPN